ncbi:hypothetical protein [Sanguibacter antarcticus]|uniref:FMN-dependent dehydrogenase n=1 Tax=Sanguibacter antarcticus TaxID=372484 RepID=A0A2A9E296_9MICO|nr:hypothetical protein [Sanguibacter antarcticus]PFG33167.1 hypothetical protein ATL42_1027 [Sanguibacter antarcticus]
MPSFRVTATIGRLARGVAPPDLLPAAAAAARELATVEAFDVAVVSGEARITVRFTADDDAHARRTADHVCATTRALAELQPTGLTRRYGARWSPVRG